MSQATFPLWLTLVSTASLLVAGGCAVWVLFDVRRRPPAMGVMTVVWPLTMLFGSVGWLWFYLRHGRAAPSGDDSGPGEKPMSISVAVGASHCGAGCTLGDLIGELTLAFLPGLAVVVGAGWLWPDDIFAAWTLDFVLAYLIGVVFQYFSIAPMRGLGLRDGLVATIKADTLSISSWQIGMYGVMAVGQFALLPAMFGGRAGSLTPEFWAMMQIAMLTGFVTAYPVNWWLIRAGIKEKM